MKALIIKYYKYLIIAAVALIVIITLDPFNVIPHSVIRLRKTSITIKEVKNISELVTAEFYGEELESLQEVYYRTKEDDIQLTYNDIKEWLLERKTKDRRDIIRQFRKTQWFDTKEYILIKRVLDVNTVKKFIEAIMPLQWKNFAAKPDYAEESKNLSNKDLKDANLVYIARGKIKAGIDLSKLSDEDMEVDNDTLYIRNIDPQILDADINPWYIPETNTPGFELVSHKRVNKISFDQIALLKSACKQKLIEKAIGRKLLQKALTNAETSLHFLLNPAKNRNFKTVRIIPTDYYRIPAKILEDNYISETEINELKLLFSKTPDQSKTAELVKIIDAADFDEESLNEWNKIKTLIKKEGDGLNAHHIASKTVHEEHLRKCDSMVMESESSWDKYHNIKHLSKKHNTNRHKDFKVFGWHPYYMGTAYKDYNFDLLWGISYFSYEVDAATGSFKTVHHWQETPMIDIAKKHDCKVYLTANCFGATNNSIFLTNQKSIEVFSNSIISLLKNRKANGVIIDFESVPKNQRYNFTDFIQSLSKKLKSEKLELGICLYAVDWNGIFQIEELNKYVDIYFLMAYDYYYSGSKTAGPVAPIASKKEWLPYNIEKSVKAYLDKGISSDKLIVSLPYYGREWKTANDDIPSRNLKAINTPTIKEIAKTALKSSKNDAASDTKIGFINHKENDYQLWYDDTTTLAKKYDWIKDNSLAGVGIWALGYDNGLNEYWELLGEKFGKKK